jgi:hypothetical protein
MPLAVNHINSFIVQSLQSAGTRSVEQPEASGDTYGRTKEEDLAYEAGLSPFS